MESIVKARWGVLGAVLALALFLVVSTTLAQSGGGYDLSWSTVDGGGGAWSMGGGYTLGGAIGQHDAGAEHSGGGYALQGGFWHSVCRPMAMDVAITCTGNQVKLSWTDDAANKAYTIHRASSAYQTPDSTNPHDTVSSAPWEWTDAAGTCGDPDINYYYVVRSVCVGAHADGDERAEFDFALVPGTS